MLKRITITVREDLARWARKKAAEENTSVSKLVGQMIERQMRITDDYWKAYDEWKKIGGIPGIASGRPLTREEAHERH